MKIRPFLSLICFGSLSYNCFGCIVWWNYFKSAENKSKEETSNKKESKNNDSANFCRMFIKHMGNIVVLNVWLYGFYFFFKLSLFNQ